MDECKLWGYTSVLLQSIDRCSQKTYMVCRKNQQLKQASTSASIYALNKKRKTFKDIISHHYTKQYSLELYAILFFWKAYMYYSKHEQQNAKPCTYSRGVEEKELKDQQLTNSKQ